VKSEALRNTLTGFTTGFLVGNDKFFGFNFNRTGLKIGLSMAVTSGVYSLGRKWDPTLTNLAAATIGKTFYNLLNEGFSLRSLKTNIKNTFINPSFFRQAGVIALSMKFRSEYKNQSLNFLNHVLLTVAVSNLTMKLADSLGVTWKGEPVYSGNILANMAGDVKKIFSSGYEDFITQGRGFSRNVNGDVKVNPVNFNFVLRIVEYNHFASKQPFLKSLGRELAHSVFISSVNVMESRLAPLYTLRKTPNQVNESNPAKIMRNQVIGLGLMYAGGYIGTRNKFLGEGLVGKAIYSIGSSGFINPENKKWYKQFALDFGPLILRIGEGKRGITIGIDEFRLYSTSIHSVLHFVVLNRKAKPRFDIRESINYGTPIFTFNNPDDVRLYGGVTMPGSVIVALKDCDVLNHEFTHILQHTRGLYLEHSSIPDFDYVKNMVLAGMLSDSINPYKLGGGYLNNIYESMANWKFGSGYVDPYYFGKFTPTNAFLILNDYKK